MPMRKEVGSGSVVEGTTGSAFCKHRNGGKVGSVVEDSRMHPSAGQEMA